jgi:hypothetical protein
MNFVFYTGRPVTLPESYYYLGTAAMPYWEARNQYRLPDYHRMDIGIKYEPEFLTFKTKNNNRKIQASIDVSLYNIFNRRNIYTIDLINNAGKDGVNPSSVYSAQGRSTFGFVPGFQFNLRF